MAQRMHLNTLLDIMIMMSLDLCLRLPQMNGYVKKFNENAAMSFRANNKHFLKNYNKIWEKVEKLTRIDFEIKPVYGDADKYIKTKIKIYADNILQIFMTKKCQKKKHHESV